MPARDLPALTAEIVECRACPRLVAWREDGRAGEAGRVPRRGVLGPAGARASAIPDARLLLVGLAPAAHGGNRTGRVFTGDRSGDFLFASHAPHRLREPGRSRSAPTTVLQLRDAYVAAAVRCAPPANKPTPAERDTCMPYLVRELQLLARRAGDRRARRVRIRGDVVDAARGRARRRRAAGAGARGSRTASRSSAGA